jgi:hypothetical protein
MGVVTVRLFDYDLVSFNERTEVITFTIAVFRVTVKWSIINLHKHMSCVSMGDEPCE